MRLYSLVVILVSMFTTAICLIIIIGEGRELLMPESGIGKYEYKEYINFEYYKQKESKRQSDDKAGIDTSKLSDSEWQARWNLYRELTIKEIKHSSLNSLLTSLLIGIVFLITGLIHIRLYRKSQPMTITI